MPRPPHYVTREEWGSKPDPIQDSRKHTPAWITIHHAGELWTTDMDPVKSVRNMQAWGKTRPQTEKPPRNTPWPDLPYHFLIAPDGRTIGTAAEIADHRDRGVDMDCRTPESELSFVL